MSEQVSYISLEAEQSVLGSMLLDSDCIRAVGGKLREKDFSSALNSAIYAAILAMDTEGQAVDGLTVADRIQKNYPAEDQKKLRAYIAQLLEVTPTAANVMEYAEIVQVSSRRRALKNAVQQAAKELDEGVAEEELLPTLEAAIQDTSARSQAELIAPKEQISRYLRHRELIDSGGNPCVRTGIDALDRLLGRGMVKKGLYFLGARPGMGKTALAIAVAEYVATHVGPVVFFSMEMSEEQITARRIAALAKVDSKIALMDKMTEKEYARVVEILPMMEKTPFYITGGHAYTPGQISNIARAQKGAAMIVVDHFSLLQLPGKQQNFTEFAMAAHALKRLAQSVDAPVLCLAQLSRENEGRSDHRPRLSDLRATGAAEEDADGVILLHRQDYYDKNYTREPGRPVLVEVALAKNRHGNTGRMEISFYPETNLFRDGRIR